jgi:hypothetical protein
MKMRKERFPVEVQLTFPRSELYCRQHAKFVFSIFSWSMLTVFRRRSSFKSWLPEIINRIVILDWLAVVIKEKFYWTLKVLVLKWEEKYLRLNRFLSKYMVSWPLFSTLFAWDEFINILRNTFYENYKFYRFWFFSDIRESYSMPDQFI